MSNVHSLESVIGYGFHDPALLSRALTHSSYANEHGEHSNERLEFLGDSVLGFLTAEFLYTTFPDISEGELTKRRAFLVCEKSLVQVAGRLELQGFIRLGKGEGTAKVRDSIVADGVEALIGAMFLDGGADASRRFIERYLFCHFTKDADYPAHSDAKTALQEIVQRDKGADLSYNLLWEEGPDHAKTFHVEVVLSGKPLAKGSGRSKKDAEQDAARKAIAQWY